MPNFNISVFDNVFDKEIATKIWEFLQRPKWSYTGGSPTGGRFWHMEKLEEESFFKEALFDIICEKHLKEKPSSFLIKRCYANGQTANQNGTAHSDSDAQNTFTFLYYPNPEWELKVRFKAVSQASPAQMAAGYADPAKTVPNVVYDLDIIIGFE